MFSMNIDTFSPTLQPLKHQHRNRSVSECAMHLSQEDVFVLKSELNFPGSWNYRLTRLAKDYIPGWLDFKETAEVIFQIYQFW